MRGTRIRRRAHTAVDAAAQLGALAHLAQFWDVPGHWNENAAWTAQQLHDFVDGQDDETELQEWKGQL
jgi:hypothetical protein